ncbi:MAG: 3-deoxy-manno-octulosonate cytidylyltransferase [Bacteroidales bacterium]|nr:3-deoxy-manno-octulosonate cytidylyltransferase [Bacteroidales bacterium]
MITNIQQSRSLPVLAVIPARWGSSRYPGKPLAKIKGIPMVIMVYQRVIKHISDVVIATDDERIAEAAHHYGAAVIMTDAHHVTGTSRCAEAARLFATGRETRFDSVINIQGDEPLIDQKDLETLISLINQSDVEIATMVKPESNPEVVNNSNRVKVVMDNNNNALYFSRLPIPFVRKPLPENFQPIFYTHRGIYAFKADILNKITTLPESPAARAESLEQLTWMEHGYRIRCGMSDSDGFGIDTPNDLEELIHSGLLG